LPVPFIVISFVPFDPPDEVDRNRTYSPTFRVTILAILLFNEISCQLFPSVLYYKTYKNLVPFAVIVVGAKAVNVKYCDA